MQLIISSASNGEGLYGWVVSGHGVQRKSKRSLCRLLPSVVPVCAARKDDSEKEAEISYARAARPLPIRLVMVRKNFDTGVESVVNNYASKVKRYCSFEDVQIKSNPKNTSDVVAQVEAEGERVLKAISPRDWVILLDERGRDVTSEQLASLIADAGDRGSSALVFCIGGPYGHGSQVRKRANVSIKLSSMVLNHQVATIVLLEQIYRAWTILRGEKYHH
ncbi:23S rRNA (pseudouridine1915-N3)-methyltransferase [Marchantia polymorpha subsp. ruderalis]|uniref:RNA methyltransferase At5g10620 n=2 Tax=Marchantia polymorpha TaxID=3197 RepID=A0AAF6BSL2_MARPO|nr:hypothetical protein MARPO_0056s0124 [Marchantia polymorpha]BBN14996.1 hypothetical protein Mp_6g16130 [Marchantia polymorpha subsp. ruderalis]|eukprot:PTQ37681.1 hypothetical protein MARPO_0056s0124 [Marchantia polymorpha]